MNKQSRVRKCRVRVNESRAREEAVSAKMQRGLPACEVPLADARGSESNGRL